MQFAKGHDGWEDLSGRGGTMRSASYGSVSDDLPGAAAPPLARRARNWRRAGVAAVATLTVLAVDGVIAVRKGAPSALAEGCDEIECMLNSPTQPPGAIKVPPRTLNPDEVEKLKQALAEEEQLESKVLSALRAARGMGARLRAQLRAVRCGMRDASGAAALGSACGAGTRDHWPRSAEALRRRTNAAAGCATGFHLLTVLACQVTDDMDYLSGEGKVNIKIVMSPEGPKGTHSQKSSTW